ncbi:MAG: hypothetical protein IJV01_06435 [Bacteroidales bacterium]|nr:hypothetical protein [Bacteroidales bacterium]
MRLRPLYLLSGLVLCFFSACGRKAGAELPPLLYTVSSRAVSVGCLPRGAADLSFVCDSLHLFRRLDYGPFKHAPMMFSQEYGGSLVDVLSIEIGRSVGDTSARVSALAQRASELGLKWSLAEGFAPSGHRAALLLSRSETALREAVGHIATGSSILDASGFREAASRMDASVPSLLLRTDAAARWLPARLPDGPFTRRSLAAFLGRFCRWLCIAFPSEDERLLYPLGDDPAFYAPVLASLPPAKSRLEPLLPEGVSFVACLALDDWRAFYERRRDWLDARSLLQRHDAACRQLASASGLRPRDWAAALDVKEIARLRWDGHEVLLIRPGKGKVDEKMHDYSGAGFAGEIFGSIFVLEDETCCAGRSGYLVIGSRDDVASLLEALCATGQVRWPARCRFALMLPGLLLSDRDDGIGCRLY